MESKAINQKNHIDHPFSFALQVFFSHMVLVDILGAVK